MSNQTKTHNIYSICRDCAKSNGAVWPTGYLATYWMDSCDACGKETGLCDVGDWNWPKGKPENWIGSLRD